MSGNRMIIKATKAYRRRCAGNGQIFNQPDAGLSEADGDMVFLCNRNVVLARYRITKKGLRHAEGADSEDPTYE